MRSVCDDTGNLAHDVSNLIRYLASVQATVVELCSLDRSWSEQVGHQQLSMNADWPTPAMYRYSLSDWALCYMKWCRPSAHWCIGFQQPAPTFRARFGKVERQPGCIRSAQWTCRLGFAWISESLLNCSRAVIGPGVFHIAARYLIQDVCCTSCLWPDILQNIS